MGWSVGSHEGRPIGYGVDAKCDFTGCGTSVDRGLSFACGDQHGDDEPDSCAGYFCERHRYAHDCAETIAAPEPERMREYFGPWPWRRTKLGCLNRVLRWTGFMVIRCVEDGKPDRFVLTWIGLPPDRAWVRHCARTSDAETLTLRGDEA